jgi:hypothetical protein
MSERDALIVNVVAGCGNLFRSPVLWSIVLTLCVESIVPGQNARIGNSTSWLEERKKHLAGYAKWAAALRPAMGEGETSFPRRTRPSYQFSRIPFKRSLH